MARPILDMEPYKRMPKAPSGLSRPRERDVMNYASPTRVEVNDAKSPGLHGDNCGPGGEQGDSYEGYERKQSSGGPGIGGDRIRSAGSQGRR